MSTPRTQDKTESGEKPAVGAVWSPPTEEKQKIPDVVPMRRGRPTVAPPVGNSSQAAGPAVRGTSGDPFAALDSKASPTDDFSSRFPSLDQFSLLHDSGTKFDFASTSSPIVASPQGPDDKVAHRLAEEAFTASRSPPQVEVVSRVHSVPSTRPSASKPSVPASSQQVSREVSQSRSSPDPLKQDVSRAQTIISSNPELQAISSQNTAKYVSTGTSMSDLQAFEPPARNMQRASQAIPASPRSTSLPRQPDRTEEQGQLSDGRSKVQARMSSYQPQPTSHVRQPSSSARQSLDTTRPTIDMVDVVPRTGLSVNRTRPTSASFEASTMEFLREREGLAVSRPQSRLQQPSPRLLPKNPSPNLIPVEDDLRTEGRSLDFLKEREGSDGKHAHKRSSLTSLTGSKSILATKFGDAFKKFESHVHLPHNHTGGRSPIPYDQDHRHGLTPIAGSEATDGRSDDGHFHDEIDHISPEKRRSLERRRLDEEERRVEAAQAEYRRRMAEGSAASEPTPLPRSIGGVPRALSIQNRVHSLLNEEQRSAPVPKTAQGYGKYSDAASVANKSDKPLPEVPRKTISVHNTQTRSAPPSAGAARGDFSAPSPTLPARSGKPPAPKKPARLNSMSVEQRPASPAKKPTEKLVAVDLPGQPTLDMTSAEKDSYIQDFSQRFPSLSAMEGGSTR